MNKISNKWNIEVGDEAYRVICGALGDKEIRGQIYERSGYLPPILNYILNGIIPDTRITASRLYRANDENVVIQFECSSECDIFDLVIPMDHINMVEEEKETKGNKIILTIFMITAMVFALLLSSPVGAFTLPTTGEGTVLLPHHKVMHTQSYTHEDLEILAQNLYFEERSYKITDVAIAQIGYVVLNRVNKKHWPNTIKEVVWQRKQFSWTHDGKSDKMKNPIAKRRAYAIAKAVLEGRIPNLVGDADHYLNRNKSKAMWWRGMKFKGRHGDHWFYTR